MIATDIASTLSGVLVGGVLGLVGGGGSVLAVPLLVYGVGVGSAHVAIGTSALAVAASALTSLAGHWRAGHVKWRCGLVFATAGVTGALAGSVVAKGVDGQKLLALFGALMIVIGALTAFKRGGEGDVAVRLDRGSARRLLPALLGLGFGTGLLSGFFGIGGGFLIVPALMLATRMPLIDAIGTSLIAVSAFGAATAASYAASGLVDWRIAALFIAGGVVGGLAGGALGKALASHKGALGSILAAVIILVGCFVVAKGLGLAA